MKIYFPWIYVGVAGGLALAALVTLVLQGVLVLVITTLGPKISLFYSSPFTKAAYASAPVVFVATWVVAIILCIRDARNWQARIDPTPEAVKFEQHLVRLYVLLSTIGAFLLGVLGLVIYRGYRTFMSMNG